MYFVYDLLKYTRKGPLDRKQYFGVYSWIFPSYFSKKRERMSKTTGVSPSFSDLMR